MEPDRELSMNDDLQEISNTPFSDDPEREKAVLEPVRRSLIEAGYYAYGTIDEQNRWSIAVDDEAGRVDVHLGRDGLEVVLWASSPGLYAEEESEWRQRSLARLARIQLPAINRGFLEPNQVAMWDDVEQGIAVSETWELPFTRQYDIGMFVREHLPRLEEVLITIERQLS
jgi:hypothetical protein